MDKVSTSHLISFSRYQTKHVIKFLLRAVDDINFKVFLGSTSKAMADGEKKRERRKYTKLKILRTKRAFLMK